jgi:Undecaprenyl-phosphate glucose phosphotransferase
MALPAESKFRESSESRLDAAIASTAKASPQRSASNLYAVGRTPDEVQKPSPRKMQVPCSAAGALFGSADAASVVMASVIGSGGYQQFISHAPWNLNLHFGAGVAGALLYVLIGRSAGFYQLPSMFSAQRSTSNISLQWLLSSLLLALLAFLFRIGIDFSRGAIICFAVLALPSLYASRSLMKGTLIWAVRQGRLHGRRVVLVGSRDELAATSEAELLRRFGLTEVTRISFPSSTGSWSLGASKGILASLDRAMSIARDCCAEQIVLALPWNDIRCIDLIRERLRNSPLPVQLLPDQKVRSLVVNPNFSVNDAFSVGIQRAPLSMPEQFAKRVLDIALAGIALVLLAPMMVVTALAIRLDTEGPALFRQQRSGFNARRFQIFKFRTMTVMEDGNKISQATRHDSRVSKFGALLRASSIDELPQLFNVIRGDMSLVGPRPHALAHDDYYSKVLSEYAFRHHVKPGITGWAQVHGYRGGTAQLELMRKRLDLDLWYINNWSIGIDLLILFRTLGELLHPRNAY